MCTHTPPITQRFPCWPWRFSFWHPPDGPAAEEAPQGDPQAGGVSVCFTHTTSPAVEVASHNLIFALLTMHSNVWGHRGGGSQAQVPVGTAGLGWPLCHPLQCGRETKLMSFSGHRCCLVVQSLKKCLEIFCCVDYVLTTRHYYTLKYNIAL